MEYRDLTFGVEIECTGKTREEAAQILSQLFGSPYTHTGDGYDKYKISDTQGRTWSVMSDSSLLAQQKRRGVVVAADGRYRVEVVTPVLKYEDIPLLQEVIRALGMAAYSPTKAWASISTSAYRGLPQSS